MIRTSSRRSLIPLLRIVLAVAAVLAGSCRGGPTATMSDLGGIEDLKAHFNADAGKPRIVLLLSPT